MAKDYVTLNVRPETKQRINILAAMLGVNVYELVEGMALREWQEQGLDGKIVSVGTLAGPEGAETPVDVQVKK